LTDFSKLKHDVGVLIYKLNTREMTWKVFCGFLIFENKTTIVILSIKPCTNIEEPKLDMRLPILLILIQFNSSRICKYVWHKLPLFWHSNKRSLD
jgi:hypothetical protein